VKEGEVYRLLQAIRWIAEIDLHDIVFDLDACLILVLLRRIISLVFKKIVKTQVLSF